MSLLTFLLQFNICKATAPLDPEAPSCGQSGLPTASLWASTAALCQPWGHWIPVILTTTLHTMYVSAAPQKVAWGCDFVCLCAPPEYCLPCRRPQVFMSERSVCILFW